MNNDEYRAVANLAEAYVYAFDDRDPDMPRRFTDLAVYVREISDGPNTVADAAREVLRVRGTLDRDPLVEAARAVADCATSDGVCADGHAWADGFALGCESCEPTRRACARLDAALGEGGDQ